MQGRLLAERVPSLQETLAVLRYAGSPRGTYRSGEPAVEQFPCATPTRAIKLSQAEEDLCTGRADESPDLPDTAQCYDQSNLLFVPTQKELSHHQAANSTHVLV